MPRTGSDKASVALFLWGQEAMRGRFSVRAALVLCLAHHLGRAEWLEDGFDGKCPGPHSVVVTAEADDGLGSQVWAYLATYAVARSMPDAFPAVPQRLLSQLGEVFWNLTIPALETLAQNCGLTHLLQDVNRNGTQLQFQGAMPHDKLLVLRSDTLPESRSLEVWDCFHEQLQLQPKLLVNSKSTLQDIEYVIRETWFLQDEELAFVAMHVRLNSNKAAMLRAMQEMREALEPRRAMFVVSCADMDWCNEALTYQTDVALAGTGDPQKPGPDFALLCSCNHTLFDLGWFGLAAAMCNQGGLTMAFGPEAQGHKAGLASALHWKVVQQ